MKRTIASVAVAVAALTATSACGEYPHTNLYEPSAQVKITINGPDLISTRGNGVFYAYTSDPVMPDAHPVWSTTNGDILQYLGTLSDGQVHFFPLQNGVVTITVGVGPHRQTKRVTVSIQP